MCHGGVFERALVPKRSHTHMCAALGLRASAPPKSAPSNGHDVNVSRLLHMGCNKHPFTIHLENHWLLHMKPNVLQNLHQKQHN